MENTINILLENAKEIANKNFCCNDSKFTVGAALLSKDGKVFTGFNIENFGIQSICAERVAFVKALTKGKKEFQAIAVVGKFQSDKYFKKTLPCGYCRQFMSQYATKDLLIVTIDEETNKIYKYKLEELLPESFEL